MFRDACRFALFLVCFGFFPGRRGVGGRVRRQGGPGGKGGVHGF